jgi:PhnB protein
MTKSDTKSVAAANVRNLGIVTPYLVATNGRSLLEFIKRAFDASELVCHARTDGSVQHAEVRIGDSVLMLGEPQPAGAAMRTTFHIRAHDVDAAYARAIAAGATSLSEPSEQPHAGRIAGVADPEGNHWYFASP